MANKNSDNAARPKPVRILMLLLLLLLAGLVWQTQLNNGLETPLPADPRPHPPAVQPTFEAAPVVPAAAVKPKIAQPKSPWLAKLKGLEFSANRNRSDGSTIHLTCTSSLFNFPSVVSTTMIVGSVAEDAPGDDVPDCIFGQEHDVVMHHSFVTRPGYNSDPTSGAQAPDITIDMGWQLHDDVVLHLPNAVKLLIQFRICQRDQSLLYTTPVEVPIHSSYDVTSLPKPVAEALVAGGGRYVVMKLQDLSDIFIYDARTIRLRRIPLPSEDYTFCAGGDTLLIAFKESNLLQTWDLPSGKKRKTKPSPVKPIILNLLMGHANGQMALIASALDAQGSQDQEYDLVDTRTLKLLPCTWSQQKFSMRHVHARCNATMSLISLRSDDFRAGTRVAFQRDQISLTAIFAYGNTYEQEMQLEQLSVGDDERIYGSTGAVYNAQLQEVTRMPGKWLIPGIGTGYFLSIAENGDLSLQQQDPQLSIPLAALPLKLSNWATKISYDDFSFDHHMVFDPQHGCIILIPPDNPDKIVNIPFDLPAIMSRAGRDFLHICSQPPFGVQENQEFSYQLEVLTNGTDITYTLGQAPPGMSLSPQGLLHWVVPQSAGVAVSLTVAAKDARGSAASQTFILEISPGAPASAPSTKPEANPTP